MVDTYGAHETRIYFVEEPAYGQTPSNPAMFGIPAENIEPAINPSNIKIRGVGNIDLQAIKKGLTSASLKIAYPLPSDAPINFLQYAKVELNKSLSIQVLYYKGMFASATNIISLLYMGSKIHKVSVECSIEDIVKATAELLAKDLEAETGKIEGATYGDQVGAVPFYESYVKKGGTPLERVTDWKFNIENNLKPVPVIRTTGGFVLKYLPHRHRNLTGEVTFEFESKDEFDDVTDDTEFSLEFGLGGSNKALFSNCKWEDLKTPTKVEDLVSLKASFVARQVAIS